MSCPPSVTRRRRASPRVGATLSTPIGTAATRSTTHAGRMATPSLVAGVDEPQLRPTPPREQFVGGRQPAPPGPRPAARSARPELRHQLVVPVPQALQQFRAELGHVGPGDVALGRGIEVMLPPV